jgi:hypothetical protein
VGEYYAYGDTGSSFDGDVSKTLLRPRKEFAYATDQFYGGMPIFGGLDALGRLNDTLDVVVPLNTRTPDTGWYMNRPLAWPFHPSGRRQAAMAVRTTSDSLGQRELWMYGGITDSVDDTKLTNEVWKYWFDSNNRWHWTKILPSNTGPWPRAGHSLIFDPGPATSDTSQRLLVIGGHGPGGIMSDTVWALRGIGGLGDSVTTPMWVVDTVTSANARWGQFAILDQKNGTYPRAYAPLGTRRVFVYGGVDRNGNYLRDLWRLSRVDNASGVFRWDWSRVNAGGRETAPSGRKGATGFYNVDLDWLCIYGGQDSSGKVADLWTIPSHPRFDADTASAKWDGRPMDTAHSAGPSAIPASFPAAFGLGAEHGFQAVNPDRWTASDTVGTWAKVSRARTLASYPHPFLLPSGNIFVTSFDNRSAWIDGEAATPSGWTVLTGDTTNYPGDGNGPGPGAMYLPGKIMVAGGYSKEDKQTYTIDLSGSTPSSGTSWQQVSDIAPSIGGNGRTQSNLTILPTGEVLLTGGTSGAEENAVLDSTAVYRTPQLWNPTTHAWSSTTGGLAPDHADRDYHSCALLLPDARVLTGGGFDQVDPYARQASIFWPPYLFNSNGSLANRPVITAVNDTVNYGDSLTIYCPDNFTLGIVCLIRPSAVTHAFNENQRYVPLTPSTKITCGGYKKIRAAITTNHDILPPGDYMLFVLRSDSIPSYSKWVRVGYSTTAITNYDSCGDGGGGDGCPYVDVAAAGSWAIQNTILNRSATNDMANDAYRLKTFPDNTDGQVRVRIRENEQESTQLDRVELVSVDHAAGTIAYMPGDHPVIGMKSAVVSVKTAAGTDLTEKFTGSGQGIIGNSGDTLIVDLGEASSRPMARVHGRRIAGTQRIQGGGGGIGLDGEFKGKPRIAGNASPQSIDQEVLNTSGILVQAPDGQGGWRTVQHYYPRALNDEALIDSLDHRLARLIFVGRHTLGAISRVSYAELDPTSSEIQPTSAQHTRLGNVLAAVDSADTSKALLIPGDTLNLTFPVSAVPQGMVRDYFLVSHGLYTADIPGRASRGPGAGVPVQFALRQNRPNPFAHSTAIQFDLPTATRVKLGIYDIQGRLIRQLVDAPYQAGQWTMTWDRTTSAGNHASAGVYFYRMNAGTYQEQKKMILLQ